MGIMDQITKEATNRQNRVNNRGASNNADLPKAKFWLNVGYEMNDKFVNLPLGIPLDTQELLSTNGNATTEEAILYNELRAAQNGLLEQFVAAAEELEPGEQMVVFEQEISEGVKMQARIRRVMEKTAIESTESRFHAPGIGGLFRKVAA